MKSVRGKTKTTRRQPSRRNRANPAIWIAGRVPNGFWSVRANRLAYLEWLGKRLKYRKTQDWYQLTRTRLIENHGGGLLATVYQHSPLRVLQDLDPAYDWKPWMMASCPQRYWHDPANRKQYMKWLGEQLGFQKPTDWYELRRQHFFDNHGQGLLGNCYGGCVLRAMQDYMPRIQWKPWMFSSVPQGYWRKRDNRVRYMDWLGKQLRFRRPEDWYRISRQDFEQNRGSTLLQAFGRNLPYRVLRDYIPDQDWHEWLFARVPRGFWRQRKHRQRFVTWLGEQLGCTTPQDWQQVTAEQVRQHGGSTLLSMYYNNSVRRMLADLLPRPGRKPRAGSKRKTKSKGKAQTRRRSRSAAGD